MNHIFSNLGDLTITDIIKVGFIDLEDDVLEMTIMNDTLFVEFNDTFLKFTSIEQYSKLKIEIVEVVSFDFDMIEDVKPAKVSVSTIILTDTMADNTIDFLEIYSPTIKDEYIICDSVSIHLVCKQEIFVDPTFYFGLNVGGAGQKDKWLENLDSSKSKQVPKMVSFN